MSLAHVSTIQALGVWSDLEQAYYGDNKYGGDTAEIYAYRLMPCEPAIMRRDGPLHSHAATMVAAQALYELLILFAEWRECEIEIDGERLGGWLAGRPFDHRCHVRITPVPATVPKET